MKAKLIVAMTLFGAFAFNDGSAQEKKSYWVVEGNVKSPNYTIIRLYNKEDVLIHEERVNGKLLNIRRRRDINFLNRKT
ncbi:MAG: hypothetical protein WDN75_07165 [Bacteroidota bacterium]